MYKNWSTKIWVEAYLLSYNQFKCAVRRSEMEIE